MTEPRPNILVAGIGNIFFGDDAFGVHVVQRLANRSLPSRVRVVDFGTRGYDLACALVDGYDLVILVDAVDRGGAPGTLYEIEPAEVDLGEPNDHESGDQAAICVEPHRLDPATVMRLAAAWNGRLPPIRLVGCQVGSLQLHPAMKLSPAVEAAVEDAIQIIESLVVTTCMKSASSRTSSRSLSVMPPVAK